MHLMNQIRIVLRDRESGLYYRGAKEWVTNPYNALTFRNIIEAEEFCRSHSLGDLQLIQQSGYFPRLRPGAQNSNLNPSSDRTSTPGSLSSN